MNENEDIILPEDFDENTPINIEEEGKTDELEGLVTNETNKESDGEGNENEEDYSKILETISKKVKYNHENVELKDFDNDIVGNIQKGMNYDKLQDKVKELENNPIMNFVTEKAKSVGLTPQEYIDRVIEFEEKQRKEQEELEIEKLTENNVPIEIAKEIMQTKALRENLQKQQAELDELKKTKELEKQKEIEFEEFLKEYPQIKPEEIPVEVWEMNKNGEKLLNAYVRFENKQLKQKLGQIEQNNKNEVTSPVKLASDKTEQESKDLFLEGFDSI